MRSVLRREKKYLVDTFTYLNNAYNFSKVLISDEHNKEDGYLVRSLYFDSIDDQDYYAKMDGIEKRRKLRLRVYDPKDSYAYLEMKEKSGEYQSKRSIKINKEDALSLIHKDYQVLTKYEDDFANLCYGILTSENYVPKTVVQYKRKAFIAKENAIRITFDSQVLASEANFNIFDENLLLYPVFPTGDVILEVKYNGFLISYIKDLIDHIDRSELSVSKYCLARQISLGFVF